MKKVIAVSILLVLIWYFYPPTSLWLQIVLGGFTTVFSIACVCAIHHTARNKESTIRIKTPSLIVKENYRAQYLELLAKQQLQRKKPYIPHLVTTEKEEVVLSEAS